jgi:hypothetical protein
LQAGCEVVALVDAAPRVGGYGVHAAKVARTGVPFYLSHTITEAHGEDHVTGVTISQVDEKFVPIKGTEKYFDVDSKGNMTLNKKKVIPIDIVIRN